MKFDYTPPPTLRRFMLSEKRVRAVRGPVGSAKSTACAMELLRRACAAPIQDDNIRRSKGVIVRNTLQQLKTTNLVTIEQLFRPIMTHKVSDATIQIRIPASGGQPAVEADWLMLPLDTPENIQRLLSLELTYGWVSEFREVPLEIVEGVLMRLGRYPSPVMLSHLPEEQRRYWYGLIMESNSFTEDSPWFEKLEENLPANWDYFVQPGAFDPGAENRENLPPSYYEDLMESNSPDWVDQYVHNRIGPSLSGQAVFRSSFIHDFHVAKAALTPTPGYPLIIGMDTGRNPAAIIAQMDMRGRLLVFASMWAKNMGMEKFLKTYVRPALQQTKFLGNPAYLVLDPACRQKAQFGEESVLDGVKRAGFVAIPAMTNAIDPRLRAVEKFLLGQIDGTGMMLIDPEGCGDLILALGSRYKYKLKKDGVTLEEIPEKLHPWSDLADALQYTCLGTESNLRGRVMHRMGFDQHGSAQEPSASGWS